MVPSDETLPRGDMPAERQRWEWPALTYVGHVGRVLQEGGGKLTPSPADPGESRKPKPASQG